MKRQLSERPLTTDEQSDLQAYAQLGLESLGVSSRSDPSDVVAAIDRFVEAWPIRDRTQVEADLSDQGAMIELSLKLGVLWGDQLVRAFSWQWTVVVDGDQERYGVVSPDRAMALYPGYFVQACLYDATRDFTAMLMFNMLDAGRIDRYQPGDYADLSKTIIRIVPRR
jgi:hypothetical protein